MSGAKSSAAIGQWGQDQDLTLMHRLGFTRLPMKAGGIRKVLIAGSMLSMTIRETSRPGRQSRST